MISFYSVNSSPDKTCAICLEPTNSDVVAHERGGNLHPLHRLCLITSFDYNSSCPTCKLGPIDGNSIQALRPLHQKIRGECSNILKGATMAFVSAAGAKIALGLCDNEADPVIRKILTTSLGVFVGYVAAKVVTQAKRTIVNVNNDRVESPGRLSNDLIVISVIGAAIESVGMASGIGAVGLTAYRFFRKR